MKAEELVKRCKKGDEQAMNMLYHLYAPKFETICRKYVNDHNKVQDLVHDSFVIILSSLHKLKDEQKFEMWSAVIVKNLALQFVRRYKQPQTLDGMEEFVVSNSPSSEDRISYNELLTLVEQLPDGYRQVFKLSVFEGMTHKEIGKILGIEPNSSSSQLYRAKKFLQELVTRYYVWIVVVIVVLVPTKFGEIAQNMTQSLSNKQPSIDTDDGKLTTTLTARNIIPIEKTISSDSTSTDDKPLVTDTIPEEQPPKEAEEQSHVNEPHTPERFLANNDMDIPVLTPTSRKFSISASVTGGAESISSQRHMVSGGIGSGDGNLTEEETRYHYHASISVSVAFNMQLSNRFGIETGLRYTHQQADITITGPNASLKTLDWHFIGIPLKGSYVLYDNPRFKAYTHAGAIIDIPVSGDSNVKWSLTSGFGLEYHLTPSLGIYAEPSLEYRLNTPLPNTGDKRFDLTIPVGIRFTW